MWIFIVFVAAICLGLYDVSQKISLKDNALMPVLFFSIVSSAVLLTPFLLISRINPEWLESTPFFVPSVDLHTHFFIFLKSIIVLVSWLFAYAGMKHLPLTIVTPIKATQPIWTVVGAMLIFSERLNFYQALGVIITLVCFYLFSVVGKKEGVSFRTNKWIWCLIAATLVGASSGLYDKYLMKQFPRMTVQVYYTYYQLITMGILTLVMGHRHQDKVKKFHWRWSIVCIALFLSCSDFLYFYALSLPNSLIAVISPLRRAGMIIPFLYGAILFKEKNLKWKILCLTGLFVGIVFLFKGSI